MSATTVRAELDLDEIWSYIATDNPTAADALLDAVGVRCRFVATQPRSGRLRPEIRKGLRTFVVGRYVIFYRPLSDGIEVVRVLHGARDIQAVFQNGG